MNNPLQREFRLGWIQQSKIEEGRYYFKIHIPLTVWGTGKATSYCEYVGGVNNHAHGCLEFYKSHYPSDSVVELCLECAKQENMRSLIK